MTFVLEAAAKCQAKGLKKPTRKMERVALFSNMHKAGQKAHAYVTGACQDNNETQKVKNGQDIPEFDEYKLETGPHRDSESREYQGRSRVL